MTQKITVVGLGYIGLPTAVMFANHGYQVHGMDVNETSVQKLQNKILHIEEPGLSEKLEKVIDNGSFTVSTKIESADIFIIAVPSPINDDKTANLEYVRSASESIYPYLKKGDLVILESTVPPKTVENIVIPEIQKSGLDIGEEVFVAHSPERVIPGKLFQELIENDRIVGGINEKSCELAVRLYKSFVKGTIHVTDATTAELVKVIENTYRDVNIAFANELVKISDQLNVNVWEAIDLANCHPRLNIHKPGPGVGGHCIAVDPWFLVELCPDLANIIHLSRQTNDSMPEYTSKKVLETLEKNNIENGKILVLGLAYKGNIDDMRESPSTEVLKNLMISKHEVVAFDPHIKENQISAQTQNLDEALENADIMVVLTDHNKFKEMNPEELNGLLKNRIIFDAKNCMELEKWKKAGFTTYTLGNSKES
ncbi:nucleotide sugar dehydrogenase [Alkalihalobacillus sp. AL-G]|uniref:nucleotide sugar dehydrogenase n=1 Tax=Alkalihalobacillus sp. AL-G TaxID=2926399 RepID=UPI00272C9F52|nr:nucleotide sugar dehydrogenase [Alkalihalobacillus sp. AL-G]WLD92993.1 nucleotide sugar dehydrogenase [Alkalihalobacillus sp. AL-G]